MAGADCPAERRWGRHDGDPAADRQRQADDLALAGALHGRGRRRVAARGHPPGRQAAIAGGGDRAGGCEGLLPGAPAPAGKPPLPAAVIERVVEMTLAEPPGERTHWTGRAMAK